MGIRSSLSVFRIVYDAIVYGRKPRLEGRVLEEALRIASLNKVLLEFMRIAGVESEQRLLEEARFNVFLEKLGEVVNALKNLDYAVFKARRPVAYVPADIDILINRRHVGEAVSRLCSLGFRIEVVEPYTVTLVKNNVIIDLYIHPSLASIVYLDGGKLLEYAIDGEVYGVQARVLCSEAEFVAITAHAIYKERLYTLNDYITFLKLYSKNALRLAENLNTAPAIYEAWRIHKLVEEEAITLPYKIPLPRWAYLLTAKLVRDKLSRTTLPKTLKWLKDRRAGTMILSKLTRETY